jgi:predicted nucleotide-binding protein (sugar kinase/HSP70/actin superfamily)
MPEMSTQTVASEEELRSLIESERFRLRRQAGLVQLQHFRRPVERTFTAEERDRVTILFGGLTWKHEKLIQAVFQGCGYKCEIIPTPDVPAFQLGKEYGNNGQCNPTYFTVGNLVQYLQGLEAKGMSREDIINNYVFFTAGSCGPCRFGMYEAEYRFALDNAGFSGFRVLLFQQQQGIKAASGEPGLKFTVDFGMGMLNALHIGDTFNDLIYQIRPYEVTPGESDRVFPEAMEELCRRMRDRDSFKYNRDAPAWVQKVLNGKKGLTRTYDILGKVADHLYGKDTRDALADCHERLNAIEVDRLRVKPIVKITGEFWAQTTEGDGNFNMFRFLEREGAQVLMEPIATWVAYMLYQARINAELRKKLNAPHKNPRAWELKKKLLNELHFRKKWLGLAAGEYLWTKFYHRVTDRLGGITHHLIPQEEMSRLAQPYYDRFTRGGEGHLEVGKNVYYSVNHLCHMVLALKPFGCMPSTQSDGAQSAVVNHYKDMIFLPIETSGEGEVNAHSRVQMALGEAKAKAKAEFERALESTGQRLDDIREYVQRHPELRKPFYRVPHAPGYAGTAAQFVLHVGKRMKRR